MGRNEMESKYSDFRTSPTIFLKTIERSRPIIQKKHKKRAQIIQQKDVQYQHTYSKLKKSKRTETVERKQIPDESNQRSGRLLRKSSSNNIEER